MGADCGVAVLGDADVVCFIEREPSERLASRPESGLQRPERHAHHSVGIEGGERTELAEGDVLGGVEVV